MNDPSPAARERRLRLLLLVGGVLSGVLVLEGAVRLAGLGPRLHSATARLVDPGWHELLDCYPSNPRGYFDLDLREPAVREKFRHLAPRRFAAVAERSPFAVSFHFNSRHFRDVEPAPKPQGVRRVAVLGDSFTEGQGVREADTTVHRLEALLRGGGGGWEVHNCARRATDFPALAELLPDALELSPDVVVYAMVLNDAARSPEFSARQRYVNDWILDNERPPEAPPLRPSLFQSRLLGLVKARVAAFRIDAETRDWYREMYGPANDRGWALTQSLIRAMQRQAVGHGARFMVVLWPILVGTDGDYPFEDTHETIRQFCTAAGIEFHDLLGALQGRRARDLWVHPVDMHPNEKAHALAAEALAPLIAGSPRR